MAIIETSRPGPFGAVTTLHVVSMIERLTENFSAWRNARRQAAVLRGLSSRQLNDIGLTDAQRPATSWTDFAH